MQDSQRGGLKEPEVWISLRMASGKQVPLWNFPHREYTIEIASTQVILVWLVFGSES